MGLALKNSGFLNSLKRCKTLIQLDTKTNKHRKKKNVDQAELSSTVWYSLFSVHVFFFFVVFFFDYSVRLQVDLRTTRCEIN